jgi:hypothetical protein
MYFDETDRLCSMPTAWTSAADMDHFARASGGRSWFRIDDLLKLAARLQVLGESQKAKRRDAK